MHCILHARRIEEEQLEAMDKHGAHLEAIRASSAGVAAKTKWIHMATNNNKEPTPKSEAWWRSNGSQVATKKNNKKRGDSWVLWLLDTRGLLGVIKGFYSYMEGTKNGEIFMIFSREIITGRSLCIYFYYKFLLKEI